MMTNSPMSRGYGSARPGVVTSPPRRRRRLVRMAAPAPVEAAVVRARRIVVALSGLLSVAYLTLTAAGPSGHTDHFNYLRTVQHMQDGQGYYPAMRQAFLDGGVTLGRARAFRLPTIFWLWRWIPEGLLYAAFLLVVVVGTTWLMVRLTNHPWAALPVALYLASAGRLANTDISELWLLVEFWSVPALAGGVLAWERGRDGLSAAASSSPRSREVSAPLLFSGCSSPSCETAPVGPGWCPSRRSPWPSPSTWSWPSATW